MVSRQAVLHSLVLFLASLVFFRCDSAEPEAEKLWGDTGINSIGMAFIRIPAGTFQMSGTHEVTITRDFYLGTYEVTQAEYKAVMGTNPSSHTGDDRRPVENVTWFEAARFANALSSAEGRQPCYDKDGNVTGGSRANPYNCTGYRLPTEAEWEYATRAGTTTAYSFGDDVGQLGDYAWYGDNSWYGANSPEGSGRGPHAVGQKLPNPWGLYDVHGNVYEWVYDWNGGSSSTFDPYGPSTGSKRVLRSGCYCNPPPTKLRSDYRWRWRPDGRAGQYGFRLACAAD